MIKGNALPQADLPDSPHARQLKAGFPWLTFEPALESEYRQTVLEAFREVADALYAIQHDAETLHARAEAADEADAAYRIAAGRYKAGGISHVNLLDAQRQQLETALDRANAAASRFVDTATLIEALGGGWWNQAGQSAQINAKPRNGK